MDRQQRSFFGQKVGMIFDSEIWNDDCAYISFLRKKDTGIWEKPSKGEGKKIKLNLGELIMLQKVVNGDLEKWSTFHKFNNQTTSISVSNKRNDSPINEVWVNVSGYGKNLYFD
jgi:hypothetical protein